MRGGREIVTSCGDFHTQKNPGDVIGLGVVCMFSWGVERELLPELHRPHEMTANFYKLARQLKVGNRCQKNYEKGSVHMLHM